MNTLTEDDIHQLAEVFKALADPARLQILGAIAAQPMTGKALAEQLGLTAPTISHHMAKLVAAGLVTATPDAQRRTYTLNEETLRGLGRTGAEPPVAATGNDLSDAERERAKTLRDFFDGPRLKQIPAQRRKRVIVLQHLLTRFAPDRGYPEKEVNALLREAHDDVATLRRELVDYGYMNRADGIYRVAGALPARGPTVAQEILGDEHAWLHDLLQGATSRVLDGHNTTINRAPDDQGDHAGSPLPDRAAVNPMPGGDQRR